MIEYIYFVKCPNCDDEPFDFFDDAKSYALNCLSRKPVITQIEVNRNDFGECTDSCDLGTVWSWEELMQDTTLADEPAVTVFTQGDFAKYRSGAYDPDTDEEFTSLDNSLDFVSDNFRKPVPADMTIDELVEALEENEDTVECSWCEDLFDKSECRYEVDLGWLCSRCEAAIKSRGETLTFRENNYWDFLNESDTSTESPLSNDESQKKEYEWKKENVEFYYDSLEITITGAAHNEHPDYGTSSWYEPVWYDEYEVTKDYTYEVEPEDVAVRIYEDFLEEEDIKDVPGGFDALMDDDIFDQYMENHFDALVKKYYDKLLDYYEEYAKEACEEYYNSKELDDALGVYVPDRED